MSIILEMGLHFANIVFLCNIEDKKHKKKQKDRLEVLYSHTFQNSLNFFAKVNSLQQNLSLVHQHDVCVLKPKYPGEKNLKALKTIAAI